MNTNQENPESEVRPKLELSDSVVTITGGTGSFGSTMARHLLNSGVGQLRLFSRDEAKQDQLRRQLSDSRVRFFIGDVRNRKSVRRVISGSDYVFHAAALKQVPSCEFFPMEAVATNVEGSENVASASLESGVKAAVFLSTDKAVYPINAMGMTKALMERTVQSLAREDSAGATRLLITRYGNVAGSRGSVIPLLLSQAKSGQALTITNSEMTRYLMTLQESVQLVLDAFANGVSGDIFVQKAKSATLRQVADSVLRVTGSSSAVRVIGTRHGEKAHETLISAEEMARTEEYGANFRIPIDVRNLNYEAFFSEGDSRVESRPYDSLNAVRMGHEELDNLVRKVEQESHLEA